MVSVIPLKEPARWQSGTLSRGRSKLFYRLDLGIPVLADTNPWTIHVHTAHPDTKQPST